MSNYTFACASVNGLTLAQKRETIKALREGIKRDVAARKAARAAGVHARAVTSTSDCACALHVAGYRSARRTGAAPR